jgi:DNA-directed RNA polymerase subunit RPC12/RpoP
MQGTGRFMCLSCGRFFSMEYNLESGKTICPFCGDMYFCDNISPDVPPYVDGGTIVKGDCGHEFITDFIGDIFYCPVCRDPIISFSGLKLKEWQNKIIEGVRP